MTKVYYIMHSCFLVELDDRYLLFDYFDKSVVSDVVEFSGSLPELDPNKYLYVFASHSHKDHWWLERNCSRRTGLKLKLPGLQDLDLRGIKIGAK